MKTVFKSLALVLATAASCLTAADEAVPLDPITGMKMTGDWEIVRNHCIICHSPRTFLQTRGTESNWTSVLEWMQTKGGLWKLDPQVEKTIVRYLADNYGPDKQSRRAPIPATLMPANPYATEARLEAEAYRKKQMELGQPQPPGPEK